MGHHVRIVAIYDSVRENPGSRSNRVSKVLSLNGIMASNEVVQRALAAAALRAQRHAELNAGITQMEKLLNQSLSPEMLPWGSALDMRQVQVYVHQRGYDIHKVNHTSRIRHWGNNCELSFSDIVNV